MELTCQKCGRQWDYNPRGKTHRIKVTCPNCGTSVRLIKKPAQKFVSPTAAAAPQKDIGDCLLEELERTGSRGTASHQFRKKPAVEVILSTDPRDVANFQLVNLGPGLVVYRGRRIREKLFGKQIPEFGHEPLPPEQIFKPAPVFQQETKKVVIPERPRWPYII